VSANAKRAAEDPKAIAYLGELAYGASAISVPVTNDAQLLQVSPTDTLTSLTQSPIGRPRAGTRVPACSTAARAACFPRGRGQSGRWGRCHP
jgi:ABC-type branched-subunit amino acid transport system substrate-binding protein